jgi:hypothetical protein
MDSNHDKVIQSPAASLSGDGLRETNITLIRCRDLCPPDRQMYTDNINV